MPRAAKQRRRAPSIIPKESLAKEIARIIDGRGLTQTELGFAVQEHVSQISLVVNGRLKGFSSERLMRLLLKLGRDIEIRTSAAKRSPGKVRVVTE